MDETDVPSAYLAVLDDERRRAIVKLVAEENRELDLSLLAGWVARAEESTERTETELHHVHLPKLDDAGVVAYSEAEHRVGPTEGTAVACRLLQLLS